MRSTWECQPHVPKFPVTANDINLKLSKERAQLVAEQFRRRGLTPAVVTGFGNTIPVASTLTEEGKEKNRRVELWLKE